MSSRFKAAFKAALVPVIVGIIFLVVAIALIIIGGMTDASGLTIVGILLFIVGIAMFAVAVGEGKTRLHAICPECQKFMGNTNEGVNYSYVCTEYKENYDGNHKFRDYTFYYTCMIECPHCGSTHTFDYKVTAKTESKANVQVTEYLKRVLKLKN